MVRSGNDRRPGSVFVGFGIPVNVAILDGCDWPPEAEMELGVPAADSAVGSRCIQRCEQSRRIGDVHVTRDCQSTEGPSVLLAHVIRPEQSGLGLLQSSHCTID